MPVPASSLSRVCGHIRDFVRQGIEANANNVDVTIGSPAGLTTGEGHLLNLFFYRFEPSGFDAGQRPDAPWNLRMFCMVTPFAVDEADGGTTVSAGETDMRLLGDVMRVFHETPILPELAVDGLSVRTRVVFMSTSDEQINQVWSTQGDTHYRPSVVYEMALTPIVPSERRGPRPPVGAVAAEVRADGDRHRRVARAAEGPPVPRTRVDTAERAWVPAIALVYEGALHRSLAFDVEGAAFAQFQPQVWIAGDPAETVDLVWEAWRPTGWVRSGPAQPAQPHGPALDPDAIPAVGPGFPTPVPLPETLAPDAHSLQLLLYAERTVRRHDAAPEETLRSAPVLITLWRSRA